MKKRDIFIIIAIVNIILLIIFCCHRDFIVIGVSINAILAWICAIIYSFHVEK